MKKASNCKYECRRWLPFPPPSSFHPIVGSHAAWLPGSGCSLANMPTSLWFSTAAPANHEPRPCCLSVLYFPIHECDARGDICILLPLLTLSASTYVLVYIYIYIKQWNWKQHGTSWWEVQSPMTICMHRMFLCHGIGCIHFRNMTNVCSYKRQQWYLISFITDFQSDIIVSLWMKVQ